MVWKKLLLIGDSNIQYGFSNEGRWASLIADQLQRKCDVINRGFSGYNTNHLKLMLPEILDEFQPSQTCGIIMLLGSNDSAEVDSSQHVSLKDYRSNLEWMIEYITNKWGLPGNKLIMISPPKINDSKWEAYCGKNGYTKNHFDALATDYANACVEVAAVKGLPCLDMNRLMREREHGYSDLLFDGLHFSTLGSQFLFDHLLPIVESSIDKDLKFNYPYWKDIDKENPILKQ